MSNSDLKSSPSHAQAENAEQSAKTQSASSLKPIARGARILFLGLACIGIPIFAALIGYAVWLSGRSNGIIEGASTSPLRVVSPINEHTSSADQQKEIEAAAHEAMEQDESLLDKLLLLVGLYSTILSFLALATVIVSRQDAKEQLQKVREDTKSLAEESEKKIEKIRRDNPSLGYLSANLSGVEIPEPVFFCSVEAASLVRIYADNLNFHLLIEPAFSVQSHQKGLERALECLQREDPSLQVHVDPDTLQTVLKGR